jgi:acyl carrier protein
MSETPPHAPQLTSVQQELHAFIVTELVSGQGQDAITADDDLIKRGIVDSLGVQQLIDFCESRYHIRVAKEDLVPQNFQTLRQLAEYVDRKQAEASPSGRLGLRSRGG